MIATVHQPNLKHDPPHYMDGKRTRAGLDADNARARELRAARRPHFPNRKRRPVNADTVIPAETAIAEVAAVVYHLYDEADVRRWFERCRSLTGHYPLVKASTIRKIKEMKLVPNEPFRKPWLSLFEPLILGTPAPAGAEGYESSPGDLYACFEEEIKAVRQRNPEVKVPPESFEAQRLGEFIRRSLGIKVVTSKGYCTAAWLLQYEVAEALCKTLGLRPYEVGI